MTANAKMQAKNVGVFYGENDALRGINLDIHAREVISFIGPSGCGKSTFLRCLNRMNDTIDSAKVVGEILLDGDNIYSKDQDVVLLRQRLVWFPKTKSLPKSIFDNIAYGPRIHGLARNHDELMHIVKVA